MEARSLDWGEAEVSDGRLTVPLTGEAEAAWTEEFGWVVERLSGGGSVAWGEVKASKKKVTVEGVKPGSEADVRHFLESVVQQVNADHADAAQDTEEQRDDDEKGEDRQMTEAFRSFADPGEQASEQGAG